MENVKYLINQIQYFIDNTINIDDLRGNYYYYYLESIPDIELTYLEQNYPAIRKTIYKVQEKLDWVDKNPDEESKSYGWINETEFYSFVLTMFNSKDFQNELIVLLEDN